MSAQAITNRRRLVAEASVLKVQYPKNIASASPIVATLNCNPSFQSITYKDICPCKWNGFGIKSR